MMDGNPGGAGWATFEARIRERRFARCLERAASSLDAGETEEAREALDEARELYPDRPEIAQFETRFAAHPQPSEILLEHSSNPYAYDLQQQEAPAGWTRVLAAVAVLVILFGLFGFGLTQLYLTGPERALLFTDVSQPSGEPVGTTSAPARLPATESAQRAARTVSDAAPETPLPAPAAAPPTIPAAEPPAASPVPVPAPTAPAAVQQPATIQRDRDVAVRDARASDAPAAKPPVPQPQTAKNTAVEKPRTMAAIERPAPPDRAPATPPAADPPVRREVPATVVTPPPTDRRPVVEPAVSTAAPEPESAAARSGLPAPPAPVPALETAPPPRPAPASPSRAEESAEIRSVLARYESAYNKLDASSATSVWPSVDQAALDRAFKGLISQRVSLGLCDITVFGEIGGASCAGKARWEPKVGGGLQTADRHWTFNLKKTGEQWRIEQVRVR